MVPLCALAALCLTASASAGQSMALPSGVPQTAWERAAQLAGLTLVSPDQPADIRCQLSEGGWELLVRGSDGVLRRELVPAPLTAQAREDLAQLAASMTELRALMLPPLPKERKEPATAAPQPADPMTDAMAAERPTRIVQAAADAAPDKAEAPLDRQAATAPAPAEPATPEEQPLAEAIPKGASDEAAAQAPGPDDPVPDYVDFIDLDAEEPPEATLPARFLAGAGIALQLRSGTSRVAAPSFALGFELGEHLFLGLDASLPGTTQLLELEGDRGLDSWDLRGALGWTAPGPVAPRLASRIGICRRRYYQDGQRIDQDLTPLAALEAALILRWRGLQLAAPTLRGVADLYVPELQVGAESPAELSAWRLEAGLELGFGTGGQKK